MLLLTCCLAAAWLLAGGCQGSSNGGDAEAHENGDAVAATDSNGANGDSNGEKKKKKEKAIKVDVAEVRRGELVIPIYADGAIRTPRSVDVRTKIGGELVRVFVRDGDRVRAGQILARIDQRQYEISLEENRYRHIQALSRIAADDDSFTVSTEALGGFVSSRDALAEERRRGRISEEEYQVKLLELELASLKAGAFRRELFEERTGLAEARTASDRAKLDLENTEIRAPFSGTVHDLQVVKGEIVSTGTQVCTIVNNEKLEAVVSVLEADLGNLVEGRPVLLAVAATDDTLEAHVDVISPRLDPATRTCEVLIRFDNDNGRYRPGMFVRAEIAGWIHPDKLMVPKTAILTRDNRPLVFKVNGEQGDRAQWLYVDIGLQNAGWVEILKVHSGGSLAPGDRVVVSDHLTLAHEAKIKVRKHRESPDRWAFAMRQTESSR
jgi:RND family efflux transporter MFP subunit